MKIIKIDKNNLVNGAGCRCVLWISGCSWNCSKCHNKEAQNPELGKTYNEEHWKEIEKQLKNPNIDGITFTGGDPLFENNREVVAYLLKKIKENFPNKNIWMWTGFIFEDIINTFPEIKYVDVLVDGLYVDSLNPRKRNLRYRGSLNQRVINVKESLEKNEIIFWQDLDGWTSQKDYEIK